MVVIPMKLNENEMIDANQMVVIPMKWN
jgi:hypothetical protein